MSLQNLTRSGGNAPGLPIGSLTRRSALRGSAAAAMALVAGATTAQSASSPDATLIDLARSLEALVAREHDVWSRIADVEEAVSQATPQAPVCRSVANPFDAGDVMSALDRIALYLGPNDFCTELAAAEAEHRTALMEHARSVEEIEKRHGLPRLKREANRLTVQLATASDELAEIRATTSTGIAAKARVLLTVAGGDWLPSSIEFERHAALLNSILQDASRLGTGVLS